MSLVHDLGTQFGYIWEFGNKAITKYIFLFLIYGSQENMRFTSGQLLFKPF